MQNIKTQNRPLSCSTQYKRRNIIDHLWRHPFIFYICRGAFGLLSGDDVNDDVADLRTRGRGSDERGRGEEVVDHGRRDGRRDGGDGESGVWSDGLPRAESMTVKVQVFPRRDETIWETDCHVGASHLLAMTSLKSI